MFDIKCFKVSAPSHETFSLLSSSYHTCRPTAPSALVVRPGETAGVYARVAQSNINKQLRWGFRPRIGTEISQTTSSGEDHHARRGLIEFE